VKALLRTAVGFSVAAALALGVAASPALGARRTTIDDFMTGLACVESGGRYDALNSASGSYGKYQIMPRVWLAWAGIYLGNRWANPTPRAQEYVARNRISDLYALHRKWPLVAHWWLTGSADPDRELWSDASTGYVDSVITIARLVRTSAGAAQVPARCFVQDLPLPKIRTQPLPRVVVTGGRAFIRDGAGADNSAVGTVMKGTLLAVLGHGRDSAGKKWLHVGLRDGSKAWIASWLTAPSD
jgi:hypothetical protein